MMRFIDLWHIPSYRYIDEASVKDSEMFKLIFIIYFYKTLHQMAFKLLNVYKSPSNRQHTTCGESWKHISEHKQNAHNDWNRAQPISDY